MITEQYVSFETAKLLKKAGFDALCSSVFTVNDEMEIDNLKRMNYNEYEASFSRPTQALAARWLREVHRIFIMISPTSDGFEYKLYDLLRERSALCFGYTKANSYEVALERGLQDSLKQILRDKEFYESIEIQRQ